MSLVRNLSLSFIYLCGLSHICIATAVAFWFLLARSFHYFSPLTWGVETWAISGLNFQASVLLMGSGLAEGGDCTCESKLLATPFLFLPCLDDPCPSRRSQRPASCALTSASTRGRSPSSASTAAKPSLRTPPTTATCGARTARTRAAPAPCAASTSPSRRITASTWRFMLLISQEPHGRVLDQLIVCISLCVSVCAWLCAQRRRGHLQWLLWWVRSLDPGHITEQRE